MSAAAPETPPSEWRLPKLRIDVDGDWFDDDVQVTHPGILANLRGNLRKDGDGHFIQTRVRIPVEVADAPFVVTRVERRGDLLHLWLNDGSEEDGRVWKCTLCYDRLKGGHEPACAKACPTDSIQFGELEELRERADQRLGKLESEHWNGARLYGHDPKDGVGGFGAFFLLLDEPEVYGLPPDPVDPTEHLPALWRTTAYAALAVFAGIAAAFVGGRR
jgi:ferredoxin